MSWVVNQGYVDYCIYDYCGFGTFSFETPHRRSLLIIELIHHRINPKDRSPKDLCASRGFSPYVLRLGDRVQHCEIIRGRWPRTTLYERYDGQRWWLAQVVLPNMKKPFNRILNKQSPNIFSLLYFLKRWQSPWNNLSVLSALSQSTSDTVSWFSAFLTSVRFLALSDCCVHFTAVTKIFGRGLFWTEPGQNIVYVSTHQYVQCICKKGPWHPIVLKDDTETSNATQDPLELCMYSMNGKGQIAQKRPYWGENRLKSKMYEKI